MGCKDDENMVRLHGRVADAISEALVTFQDATWAAGRAAGFAAARAKALDACREAGSVADVSKKVAGMTDRDVAPEDPRG